MLQESAYRFVTFRQGMCDTTTWKAQTTFVTLELVRPNTCTLYKQFGNILTIQAFLENMGRFISWMKQKLEAWLTNF